MSDTKKPIPGEEDYFQVKVEVLKVGTTVTFDSYVYLEKNERFNLWLRSSSVFSDSKQENLKNLGHQRVFVLN